MKRKFALQFVFGTLAISLIWAVPRSVHAASQDTATQYVKRSEDQTQGDSLKATVTMTIHRASGDRSLKFKMQQFKREKSLLKVLDPLKDRGTGSLRIGTSLWQFLPNVDRIIRIPSSMMLQSWMGSDFTNDDLVKTSSLTRDYTHQIEGEETAGGETQVKILCMPKPDAPVVWEKFAFGFEKKDSVPLKQEYYSEHDELLKVMDGSDIRTFGAHTMPTRLVMRVPKRQGEQTTMIFADVVFDQSIDASVFTQENLRKSSD